MSELTKVFDFILQQISMVWNIIKSSVSLFTAIFDTFGSFFDDLFKHLGIYDSITYSLDILLDLATTLNQLLEETSLVSTILSFCAFDTFFTAFLTSITVTFGVLISLVSFALVTLVPVLISFLTVKGILRLVRLCTAGVAKP